MGTSLLPGAAPPILNNVESNRPDRRPSRLTLRELVLGLTMALAMLALVLGTLHFLSPRWSPINAAFTGEALPAVPRPQRPATLDPGLFSGRAAEAYRVAHERPALLERLPCYCNCFTQQGHQNLLDCFADTHAAHCEMCQNIAFRAAALALRRYAPEDVKAMIDREFAPRK